jgi:hypothetical protein
MGTRTFVGSKFWRIWRIRFGGPASGLASGNPPNPPGAPPAIKLAVFGKRMLWEWYGDAEHEGENAKMKKNKLRRLGGRRKSGGIHHSFGCLGGKLPCFLDKPCEFSGHFVCFRLSILHPFPFNLSLHSELNPHQSRPSAQHGSGCHSWFLKFSYLFFIFSYFTFISNNSHFCLCLFSLQLSATSIQCFPHP